jgi:hypothetical protein
MLAAARENLYAQLIFQQPDLLADAGLGGEQALGGLGHIQVVMRDLPDVTQLLQLHAPSGTKTIIWL